MRSKGSVFVCAIIFILIFANVLILAEEVENPGYELQVDEKTSISKVTFTEFGAEYEVGGNKWANILPQSAERNAHIIFNENGEAKEAEFTTGNVSSEYVFGNDNVSIPPGSFVSYKGRKINIQAPTGSTFESLPSRVSEFKSQFIRDKTIELSGNNITILGNNTLQEGSLYFIGEDVYIGSGSVMDSLKINGKSDYKILLDGSKPQNLGENFISMNSKTKRLYVNGRSEDYGDENPDVTFLPGNPFIPVEENNDVRIFTKGFSVLSLSITSDSDIPVINLGRNTYLASSILSSPEDITVRPFFNNGKVLLSYGTAKNDIIVKPSNLAVEPVDSVPVLVKPWNTAKSIYINEFNQLAVLDNKFLSSGNSLKNIDSYLASSSTNVVFSTLKYNNTLLPPEGFFNPISPFYLGPSIEGLPSVILGFDRYHIFSDSD